jgi:hypothetical protein
VTETAALTVGLTFAHKAERIMEDRYLVDDHAVDLADDLDTCTCGDTQCWHTISALVHQAREKEIR